jgi:anion-transporting  ArsA/GET3 family ATPase
VPPSCGGSVPSGHRTLIPALAALAQKRLLFFAGKGGVGKTTVAATVAFTLARHGKKTLLIELDDSARAARLLGVSSTDEHPTGPQPLSPSLFVLSTSGQIALEEYLQLIIPFKPLLRAIVESRAYQYFVAAAPGLKELLTMGKVWYEERKREAEHPLWDIIVVDLPATGHSLQYLRMPRAAHETFGGVISREAERIAAVLHDPEKTAVNLVTTPDELPISETQDAYQQLTAELRLPMGALFINRMHTAPLSAEILQATTIRGTPSAAERQLIELLLRCGQTEAMETDIQTMRLQPLQSLPLPIVPIPFAVAAASDETIVEQLSWALTTAVQDTSPRNKKNTQKRRRAQRTSHAETSHVEPEE